MFLYFLDFAEKILPSITHETLKSVIANFTAASLLTKRNEVSFPNNRQDHKCIKIGIK